MAELGALTGSAAHGKSVLFVCIENSSRSVMAEGFAKRLGLNASSAGTFPAIQTNPLVVEAMREVGIDVSQTKPKELTEKMVEASDIVILTDSTLSKAIPGSLMRRMKKMLVEWALPDPQGKNIEEIRYVRDQIERLVSTIPLDLGITSRRPSPSSLVSQ